MLKNILTGVILFVAIILQICILPGLLPMWVVPNLFIILVASCGFMNGENFGILVGFILGLTYDVFFSDVVGLHALLYMYIGFVNGKFARVFYPEDIKLPLALITVSDLTYSLLCYIVMFMLRGRLDFLFYLKSIIVPEVVGTLVATLVVYPLILRFYEWLRIRERRSEQRFV